MSRGASQAVALLALLVPTQIEAQTPKPAVDLTAQALEKIPVGTVIAKDPPQGWSHLVLFATPTLTADDLKEAPKIAADYARMFKFTILANVAPPAAGRPGHTLEKLARGFATELKGQETVISSQKTLGVSMGFFGGQILEENEKILDRDLLQVVRTPTMSIFDGQATMRQKDEHIRMVIRHVVLVDPKTGRLNFLVWLLSKDYEIAEETVQSLPNSMREPRYLSVKRDKFVLGIPTADAFALWKIPQGTPIKYDDQLLGVASLKTFSEASALKTEQVLRAVVDRAAGK